MLSLLFLLCSLAWAIDSERDFTGTWILQTDRSAVRQMPFPAESSLRLRMDHTSLVIASEHGERTIVLGGATSNQDVGPASLSTMTKWEGAALLVNSLSRAGRSYSLAERWRLSHDRSTLTIRRQFGIGGGEHESTLVYEREGVTKAPAHTSEAPRVLATRPEPAPDAYRLDAGSRLVARLRGAVSTQHAKPGDRVYLETVVPITLNDRIVVPVGSQVIATITESTRAGRAKGRAALQFRFDSLTLPSGVHRDISGHVTAADGRRLQEEGRISGEDDRGGDARKVGETTAAGTGVGATVGSAAGRTGAGAGIGAAAGAAAGLGRILGSRGPDVVLRSGTVLEITLDRAIQFSAADLAPHSR